MNLIEAEFRVFLGSSQRLPFSPSAFGNDAASQVRYAAMQTSHTESLHIRVCAYRNRVIRLQAICFCAVEEGASMASVPCNTIQPSTDANGIRTVYASIRRSNNLSRVSKVLYVC